MKHERIEIVKEHPGLYRRVKYLEIPDGWVDLVYELSGRLEELINGDKTGLCCASQVKEKYGGLRFYMTVSSEKMDKIIDEYEERSRGMCQECGKPGEIRVGSWVETLCEGCYKP